MTTVYRILTGAEWRRAQAAGAITPNALDQASGFLHLSGEAQLLETAARYFPPETRPVALELDADALGEALKWEPVASRGGARFPHLYLAELPLTHVHAVTSLRALATGAYALSARVPRAGTPNTSGER
ncbi:MAG: DUF952 domain-containing protein [Myxococcota bacterium]|nr:DUF952 domain-containing protein [Myxococcota bacterium]